MSGSARILALETVLGNHLGEKARRRAPAMLLELMALGCVLMELHEIPAADRKGGLLVRIAAELEAESEGAAMGAAVLHADAARQAVR